MRKQLLFGLLILMLVTAGSVFAQPDRPARPWLGISIDDTDDGVTVTSVMPDSPAAEAGLQEGDIIQSIDGEEVAGTRNLIRVVRGSEIGSTHTLGVLRGDETLEVTVTLGETPEEIGGRGNQFELIPPGGMGDGNMMMFLMGVMIESTDEGWVVTQVMPNVETPLQEGDVIVSINGEPVVDMDDPFMFELFNLDQPMVEVAVLRDGEEVTLEIDLETMFPSVPGMPGMPFETQNRIVLGVQFQLLDEEVATEVGIEQTEGAYIMEVLPGTPAEDAGLEVGDVILSVNGTAVSEENNLPDLLVEAGENATVTLEVLRGEETLSIDVTLAAQPLMFPEGVPTMPGGAPGFDMPFPPSFFGDLGDMLNEFDLTLPNGGSLHIDCTDADGVVFSLHFDVDENGEMSSNLSTEGLGFDELENLDLSALECQINTDVEEGSDSDA